MARSPEDRDVASWVRTVASSVMLGLVVFIVLADRFGPVVSVSYVPIGDAALGLLLGALLALVGVQGIDYFRGRK